MDFNVYQYLGGMQGFIQGFYVLVIGIVAMFVVLIAVIKIKRFRKLKIPIIEYIQLKNGSLSTKTHLKAGWFGKHQKFWGLKETGEDELVTSDKRRIPNAASTDFEEINGRMGLKVLRKPDDPKILIPISKSEIKNDKLIMEIAPADYRDVAVRLVELEHQNLMSNFNKYAPTFMALGMILLCFVICTYMVQQAGKFGLEVIAQAKSINKNPAPITSNKAP